MQTLTVALADDESMARARLERLLGALPDVELSASCSDASVLLDHVSSHPVDIVFLDVDMPGLTGTEAADLLGTDGPLIVYCTAHAEHAVQAFAQGALDYLLKPVTAKRLRQALDRARQRLSSSATVPALERLAISTRGGVVLLDPDTITHAMKDDALVTLFIDNGDRYLTDSPLQKLLDALPADRFWRVQRQAILNLSAVHCLDPLPSGGYVARLHSGPTVPVSRQAARRLRRWLKLR